MSKTCAPVGATTRDLIAAVQQNGSDARTALDSLLAANAGLIKAAVSRIKPVDPDGSLLQEARLAFVRAIGSYDLGRAVSFSSYAWKAMSGAVHGLVDRTAVNAERDLHWDSGDDAGGDDGDPAGVPVPPMPGLPFDERFAVVDAVGRLPAGDRRVIGGLYWQRESQGHVAQSLGISQQAVAKRHRRILTQLQFALST